MKLKLSTILLVLAAIVFAGGIYFWDQGRAPQSQPGETASDNKPLFQFKEADIAKVSLQNKGQTIALEKTASGWQLKAPKPGVADDGTVTFLLNKLTTGTSSRTLSVKPEQLSEFGLTQPTATIDVTLNDQKTHQLALGNQTYDQSSIYARVNPNQSSAISVVLVPTGFLDAVNRPLIDWQAKPKNPPSTSTPQPSVPEQSPTSSTSTPSTTPTTSPAPSSP